MRMHNHKGTQEKLINIGIGFQQGQPSIILYGNIKCKPCQEAYKVTRVY